MEGDKVYKKSRILAWVAFVGLLVFAFISVAYTILSLISNHFNALLRWICLIGNLCSITLYCIASFCPHCKHLRVVVRPWRSKAAPCLRCGKTVEYY